MDLELGDGEWNNRLVVLPTMMVLDKKMRSASSFISRSGAAANTRMGECLIGDETGNISPHLLLLLLLSVSNFSVL